MDLRERDELYDWLENGPLEERFRRMVRDRLEELEAEVRRLNPNSEVLRYTAAAALDPRLNRLTALAARGAGRDAERN